MPSTRTQTLDARGEVVADIETDKAAMEVESPATGWLRERGLARARLFVHTENPRARRAYEKAGFVATGAQITAVNGPELEMVRAL